MPAPDDLRSGGPAPGLRWLRSLARDARRVASLGAMPPLHIDDAPGGRELRLMTPPDLDGVVQGGSGGAGYQVAEATFSTSTGAWTILPGGRTVTAFEYNAQTIAAGTPVHCRLTRAGDWRFFVARGPAPPSTPPCGKATTVCGQASVNCCSLPAPMTFTLRRAGAVVGTCTASSAGGGGAATCCIDTSTISAGDALDWTIAIDGLSPLSGTVAAPACGKAVFVGGGYPLTVLYSTLTLTDPLGNLITLTPVGSTDEYTGSFLYPNLCNAPHLGSGITLAYSFNGADNPCNLKVTPSSPCSSAFICVYPHHFGFMGSPFLEASGGTVSASDSTCPPMLRHWTVVPYFDGSGYLDGDIVWVPFWGNNPFGGSPPLHFTLTP